MTRAGVGAGAFPRHRERAGAPVRSAGVPGLSRGSAGCSEGSRLCCATQLRCRFPPRCAPHPVAASSHPGGSRCGSPWRTAHGTGRRRYLLCNFIHTGYPAAPIPPAAPGQREAGRREAGCSGGSRPLGGSLAGVVDLDLLVDGGQHLPHSGLQPAQLGRFGIQHPLVPLVLLLQRCRDTGT